MMNMKIYAYSLIKSHRPLHPCVEDTPVGIQRGRLMLVFPTKSCYLLRHCFQLLAISCDQSCIGALAAHVAMELLNVCHSGKENVIAHPHHRGPVSTDICDIKVRFHCLFAGAMSAPTFAVSWFGFNSPSPWEEVQP